MRSLAPPNNPQQSHIKTHTYNKTTTTTYPLPRDEEGLGQFMHWSLAAMFTNEARSAGELAVVGLGL
jgi:hypothetical protein